MSVFTHFRTQSVLSRINPAIKLLLAIAVILLASVIFDAFTLLGLLGLGTGILVLLGRVSLRLLIRGLLPFALFGIGFFWMNAALPRTSGTEWFSLGWVTISVEGARNGLSFFIRSLVFGVWSMLFVATTQPTELVLSLIHQLRVPPRFAYSALAAYRYLPSLQQELHYIRAAHRLRGLGEVGGLRGRIQQVRRYTIPLLAGAMRRATRVAAAMEARGFGGSNRTYLRQPSISHWDIGVVSALLLAIMTLLIMSAQMGHLQLWRGHLWE